MGEYGDNGIIGEVQTCEEVLSVGAVCVRVSVRECVLWVTFVC